MKLQEALKRVAKRPYNYPRYGKLHVAGRTGRDVRRVGPPTYNAGRGLRHLLLGPAGLQTLRRAWDLGAAERGN